MTNLYLEALTLGEKFSLSGEILLRGLGTVFMVLIILWGILAIFGKVFSGTGKKAAEQKTERGSKFSPRFSVARFSYCPKKIYALRVPPPFRAEIIRQRV